MLDKLTIKEILGLMMIIQGLGITLSFLIYINQIKESFKGDKNGSN